MQISVISPVYDAVAYVEQAVKSALDQHETAEVILIEDASTDNSLAVCEQLTQQYNRVRLLRHPEGMNRGTAASRNVGILNAKYDYIAFLDADDFYLPARFETASKIFSQSPFVEGVYEATGVHFESDSARKGWLNSPLHQGQMITTIKEHLPPDQLFHALVSGGGKGSFHTNAITVKRSLFLKTGLFDECLVLHQDTVMWIKMAAVGNLVAGNINKPVAIRRIHNNNRILHLPKGPSPYLKMMDEILTKWASQVGLSDTQMDLLQYRAWCNSLFNYDIYWRGEVESKAGSLITQVLRKAVFLVDTLVRSPSLMFSGYLLRFVFGALRRLV